MNIRKNGIILKNSVVFIYLDDTNFEMIDDSSNPLLYHHALTNICFSLRKITIYRYYNNIFI